VAVDTPRRRCLCREAAASFKGMWVSHPRLTFFYFAYCAPVHTSHYRPLIYSHTVRQYTQYTHHTIDLWTTRILCASTHSTHITLSTSELLA